MKRTIFVLINKDGNTKDERGNPYGWYFENEKALCEQYCKANDLWYKEKIITII